MSAEVIQNKRLIAPSGTRLIEGFEDRQKVINRMNAIVESAVMAYSANPDTSAIVVPLDGGLVFYYLFMKKCAGVGIDLNSINIIFAAKSTKSFKMSAINESIRQFIIIDDIADTLKTTYDKLIQQLKRYHHSEIVVELIAFTKKIHTPKYEGNFEDTMLLHTNEWILCSLGMNSGLFDDDPTSILERVTLIPLLRDGEIDAQEYFTFLLDNSIFENILQHELFDLYRSLNAKNSNEKLKLMRSFHNKLATNLSGALREP